MRVYAYVHIEPSTRTRTLTQHAHYCGATLAVIHQQRAARVARTRSGHPAAIHSDGFGVHGYDGFLNKPKRTRTPGFCETEARQGRDAADSYVRHGHAGLGP